MRYPGWIILIAVVAATAISQPADALRIRDLCEIQGARGNDLRGVGLIVGLAGTGDKSADAVQRQQRMLDRMDIEIGMVKDLSSANVAVVMVTATLPAFGKEGTRIDVQVASLYDCKSLEGGTLLSTYLIGEDKRVYAVAQGPVSVGGFNVSAGGGGGTSVQQNHVTVGRVPNGAYVEREVPSTITDGERIALLLRRPDFGTASLIREAIETQFGPGAARAFGAGTVNVTIPAEGRADLVGFIAAVQDIDVQAAPILARVVINERTGTIVVGGEVMIRPCQVAHGDLTITIATTPVVSQPLPFSGGATVVGEVTDVNVTAPKVRLMPVKGESAADVATALNRLKVTPRDMIAIFQALSKAGALEADLEIM